MGAGMRTLAAADNDSAAAFLYHAASLREGYRHDIINKIEFDGGMEMLIFDGKDSTIYVVAAVSMILLFSLQYFICTRTERSIIRAIPFIYPFLLLALAMICYASPDGSASSSRIRSDLYGIHSAGTIPLPVRERAFEKRLNQFQREPGAHMDTDFINLTPQNINEEHLCCIIRSKKSHPGVETKKKMGFRTAEGRPHFSKIGRQSHCLY